jgi:ribosomal protein S24E
MEAKKNMRNEMFNREEIIFDLESGKTPSFSEVKKKISEDYSKPEENIDVFNIKGNFGKNVFSIHAYVYDSKQDLEKAVQKTKKQRDAEKKAAEEAKKAEETVKTDN